MDNKMFWCTMIYLCEVIIVYLSFIWAVRKNIFFMQPEYSLSSLLSIVLAAALVWPVTFMWLIKENYSRNRKEKK